MFNETYICTIISAKQYLLNPVNWTCCYSHLSKQSSIASFVGAKKMSADHVCCRRSLNLLPIYIQLQHPLDYIKYGAKLSEHYFQSTLSYRKVEIHKVSVDNVT